MKSNYKRIGNYIRLVDERNSGHNVKNLLGLSISKQFIPSVANLVGTDMENYKIIRKNQLACSTMQIRRDKKMPIALLKEVNEAIISSAYPVFEIINPEELLPEYLMMWFSRQEFDREACFHAIGGVRGSLEWEDFCDMKLVVPHPNKQSKITKEYNTIVNRININNQLIRKLEATAQSIYKQWFLDFEFPNEEGKPYKSSGGEMVESVLGEIPKGWRVEKMAELAQLRYGKMLDASLFIEKGYPVFSGYGIRGYFSEYMYAEPQILILCRGVSGTGEVKLSPSFSWITNLSIIVEVDENIIKKMYLFYYLKNRNLRSLDSGSAQSQITTSDLYNENILLPSIKIQTKFHDLFCKINSQKELLISEISLLIKLESLLLAKLSTIEN
jgi:type I restriction enzyme S subunit